MRNFRSLSRLLPTQDAGAISSQIEGTSVCSAGEPSSPQQTQQFNAVIVDVEMMFGSKLAQGLDDSLSVNFDKTG